MFMRVCSQQLVSVLHRSDVVAACMEGNTPKSLQAWTTNVAMDKVQRRVFVSFGVLARCLRMMPSKEVSVINTACLNISSELLSIGWVQ
jgi:hypothetical protein